MGGSGSRRGGHHTSNMTVASSCNSHQRSKEPVETFPRKGRRRGTEARHDIETTANDDLSRSDDSPQHFFPPHQQQASLHERKLPASVSVHDYHLSPPTKYQIYRRRRCPKQKSYIPIDSTKVDLETSSLKVGPWSDLDF